MSEVAEKQKPLFDLSTMRRITPNWIDPMQPLEIPAYPLHVKAHRLQLLLAKLDLQAEKNGSAFNSANYLAVLNEYTKCVTEIKQGKTADEVLEQGGLDSQRTEPSEAPAVGAGAASSVDSGVSTDNPLAG